MMQPATRTNLADSAADSLRTEIVGGRWALGERIPNEAALSEMLSVSRGTVREAVRALVSQGFLETRQGSGTYVTSTVDPGAALMRMKRAGLRDLWEARTALDAEAARLAAMRHTPAGLQRIRRLLEERGKPSESAPEDFIRRDIAFHRGIVEMSGNRAMVELYDFFTASIAETINSTLAGELPEPDTTAHTAILEGIASGNPDHAAATVRAFMAPVFLELDRLLSQ